jgi:hypothetical protein
MPGLMTSLPSFEGELAGRLRGEVREMAGAYVEAVLEEVARDAVAGVYVKGSATRAWDSAIDYVPEISDVDIQVRFVDEGEAGRFFGSLGLALRVAEHALERFYGRVASPLHVPRPQLLALNTLERMPGYFPSPEGTVRTLYGQAYEAASREDYASTQAEDARLFVEDAEWVRVELPEKVIDRPGHHAWRAISLLGWRVSPAGPRLLTHLGMHPYDAWSLNRSGVVRELIARGQAPLAEAYAGFYLAGWDGFRSQFREGEAARRALQAVGSLFSEGIAVIRP